MSPAVKGTFCSWKGLFFFNFSFFFFFLSIFVEFVPGLLLIYVLVFWRQGIQCLSSSSRHGTCTPCIEKHRGTRSLSALEPALPPFSPLSGHTLAPSLGSEAWELPSGSWPSVSPAGTSRS